MRKGWGGAALAAFALLGTGWALDARRRNERYRATHRILVDLLLNALAAENAATARHSRRVADLAYTLAEASGLHGSALTTLRVAALLHDLGKMEDRFWPIVHSREPLTREQRAEMEDHPDESARILGPLERIHPGLREIVASHHERWDGDGYPEGRRGEAIPLAARIIVVADVFDALTQPREYRDPLPPEEVFAEIHRGRGTQFDPALVDLLDAPAVRAAWVEIARRGRAEERAPGRPMVETSEAR